ncbi:hypothetical protein [Megasphaera lornae]|uniref:hypothetical protein n=1 Tax=Megasphaera lornae TaxID=1000568 RepID=UPI0002F37981|nr:hypothetical protein [Megasphaera lornae]
MAERLLSRGRGDVFFAASIPKTAGRAAYRETEFAMRRRRKVRVTAKRGIHPKKR